MMTAIGQGETVVSPFEMALVAATVANGGTMMNPYYIDHIETYDGDIVKQYAPVKYKELMSEEEVDILSGFMKEVVTDGTARKISGEEYTAAGKTGSAEYGSEGGAEGTHSWFVGYLDAENPKPAISVIIEDGVCKLADRSALAGSVATMDRLIRTVVQKAEIPLEDAVRMASETPARIMGVYDRKGSLQRGKDADIQILDKDLNVRAVWAMGKLVEGTNKLF